MMPTGVQCLFTIGVVVALLFWNPSYGSAQAAQADEVRHRNECRLARQILVHGQPAKKVEWALQKVEGCEGAEETIADALESFRGAEVQVAELERVVLLTTYVVDAGIFAKALEIAADPNAGSIGRLQAMRVLFNQFVPGHFTDFDGFVKGGAFFMPPAAGEPLVLQPLPPDAGELVLAGLPPVTEGPGVDQRFVIAVEGLRGIARGLIILRDDPDLQ